MSNGNNKTNVIQRTITELQEIKSRSAATDNMLSHAFYKAVLLYIRYEREALLQAVLTTCERLRVKNVKEVITWATNGEVTFQRVETLIVPIVDVKSVALYSFVGYKKAHKSLFALIDEYQAERKAEREHARKKAVEALRRADLMNAMQATEKAIKAVSKKFPQHETLFSYLQEALDNYTNKLE